LEIDAQCRCVDRGPAIGLHNVDLIMAVTLLLFVFAAAVSSILLAIDRRLRANT
jgi:hypothetical protein